jgi:VRR-NUC domain
MQEIDIQNSIRIALNPVAVTFRANVGTFKTTDNNVDRYISTGLPKGFSDLFGFRKSDGKIFFIEVKRKNGIVSDDQKNFIEQMKMQGAIVGIAHSVEEALEIITD